MLSNYIKVKAITSREKTQDYKLYYPSLRAFQCFATIPQLQKLGRKKG